MRRLTLLVVLVATSAAQANQIAQIDLYHEFTSVPSPVPLDFGIYGNDVRGLVAVFHLPDSAPGTKYYAAPQKVDDMYYSLTHTSDGFGHTWTALTSATIGNFMWTSGASTLFSPTHSNTGLGGSSTCCAIVNGSPDVFTTPWKGVSVERTGWAPSGGKFGSTLTVRIYDTPVPEPSTLALGAILLAALVFRRPAVKK